MFQTLPYDALYVARTEMMLEELRRRLVFGRPLPLATPPPPPPPPPPPSLLTPKAAVAAGLARFTRDAGSDSSGGGDSDAWSDSD